MRVLDVFEVAELAIYPLWQYQQTDKSDKDARRHLDALEYSAYLDATDKSRYMAILNELIPPVSDPIPLPDGLRRPLISAKTWALRGHPDTRIAWRAETSPAWPP